MTVNFPVIPASSSSAPNIASACGYILQHGLFTTKLLLNGMILFKMIIIIFMKNVIYINWFILACNDFIEKRRRTEKKKGEGD